MDLPKTEVELRTAAVDVMTQFVDEVKKQLGEDFSEDLPCFDVRALKAACVWAARLAIRRYCPHLENEGERLMEGEFSAENDLPI